MKNISLRYRLLGSYLLLLIITLSVIGAALLIFLSSRPEPDNTLYQRLTNVLRDIDVDTIANEYFERNPDSTGVTPSDLYTAFAEWNGVRIMIVNPDSGRVTFDSSGEYNRGEIIQVRYAEYTPPMLIRRLLPDDYELVYGRFAGRDDQEWFFAGVVEFSGLTASRAALVADIRDERSSLRSALAEFSSALALPLIQAGLIGFIVAFVLAAFMSRTIAKPLQRFAMAAQSVARGHFNEHVPEEGAPEMRTVATAINVMSHEVSATQQAQRDFMANVSHDLKTPLTSIQGYSQAIMDDAVKDPKHAASIIYDEASRLTRMVSELTDLARLQAGGVVLRHDAVNLSDLLVAVAQRIEVVARRKNQTLHIQAAPNLFINGDGDRIAQVITNLLSNAIKYTPEGGLISASVQRREQGAAIIISDNGIGIPLEQQNRIFERFYQVDQTRGPKRGTGLGLAITREIVLAHRGTISVESAGVNRGSTFTVWLPT